MATTPPADASVTTNFIHEIVAEDIRTNRNGAQGQVVTRFPPEPNAYLHLGHAKAIYLDFGTAAKFGGRCHLRMDDTNPAKEEQEYIDAIKADVRWLGFEWGEHEYHASDYFETLYEWAVLLIQAGKAFVCDLSAEEVSKTRGTLTAPGQDSPFRNRGVAENLDLFARMRKGEFPDGTRTLRAKIGMDQPNITMRDPVMYRIMHTEHPRTGNQWCIYPMYDWAHGQSDWIEGITHSICTLEYEEHRPLYDWYIAQLQALGVSPKGVSHRPRQYEFARLNVTGMMMSKRKLIELVQQKIVRGFDDPRMPTLCGLRRRGYTKEALWDFCERIGVAKRENTIDIALLEYCLREDLNKRARRAMAVLKPVKLIIDNYPAGQAEEFDAVNNPEDPAAGSRKVAFSRELYIEQEDFQEVPPPKYYRLFPGNEVRLRYAYLVKCVSVEKDASGRVTAVHCTYDPASKGGNAPDGRKVKATIHWVSAPHAVDAEVRLYEPLFATEDPNKVPDGGDWRSNLTPNSMQTLTVKVEAMLGGAQPGDKVQFERVGYFCCDPDTRDAGRPVFNRTVSLKDTWTKIQKKNG